MKLVKVSEHRIVDAKSGKQWERQGRYLVMWTPADAQKDDDTVSLKLKDEEADVLWAWLLSNVEG